MLDAASYFPYQIELFSGTKVPQSSIFYDNSTPDRLFDSSSRVWYRLRFGNQVWIQGSDGHDIQVGKLVSVKYTPPTLDTYLD